MKIEIELTEEEAACLWDDVTWGGQHPRTLEWIAQSYLEGRAAVAVAQFPPASLPGLLIKFREANPPPVEPPARTDAEIIAQTEELALGLLLMNGYKYSGETRISQSDNPRAGEAWRMACKAQEILTATDVQNALDNEEDAPAADHAQQAV